MRQHGDVELSTGKNAGRGPAEPMACKLEGAKMGFSTIERVVFRVFRLG